MSHLKCIYIPVSQETPLHPTEHPHRPGGIHAPLTHSSEHSNVDVAFAGAMMLMYSSTELLTYVCVCVRERERVRVCVLMIYSLVYASTLVDNRKVNKQVYK